MIADNLFDALCMGAREAVCIAHLAAWSNKVQQPPDEVEHIYAFVDSGTKELYAQWHPVLRRAGVSLRLTGVFIHQSPYAHYHHPRDGRVGPELGDLLIVYDHQGRKPVRRAVLVQVKRCKLGLPKGTPDARQEYLYKHWPDFELKGRGPHNRRFIPGRRHLGSNGESGRYGLVADDIVPCWPGHYPWHPYKFPWTFSDPADPVRTVGGEDTGSFLTNMLYASKHRRGRDAAPIQGSLALSPPALPNNHFDVTIEELLRLTAAKALRSKHHPHITGVRGHSVLCFQDADPGFIAGNELGQAFSFAAGGGDGRGTEIIEPPDDFEDEGGISTLLIETQTGVG